MTAGRIVAIWSKRFHRGPMDRIDTATLEVGRGLTESVGHGRKRQVTLIEQEVWDELMYQLGATVDPSARRASMMVAGLRLRETRGKVLALGTARLRILGETKPCERMEEAWPGLREAMYPEWRGGAFGEVVQGGAVSVGDAVGWVSGAEARETREAGVT